MLVLLQRVRVPTPYNNVLKVLPKLVARPEVAWIRKVEERKVLCQVVLDRRACQNNTSLDVQAGERLEGLGLCANYEISLMGG